MSHVSESTPAKPAKRYFTVPELSKRWNLPVEQIWQEIEAEHLSAEIVLSGEIHSLPRHVARYFSTGQTSFLETTRRPVSNAGLMLGLGDESHYYEADKVRVSALHVQQFEAANQLIAEAPTKIGRTTMLEQTDFSVDELAAKWKCKPIAIWQRIEVKELAAELILHGQRLPVQSHIARSFSTARNDTVYADPMRPQPIAAKRAQLQDFNQVFLRPHMVRISAQAVLDFESKHLPSFDGWLKQDLWTVRETAFLLCGRTPKENAAADNEFAEARKAISLAIKAHNLNTADFYAYSGDVPLEDHHLRPKEVIAWASGKFPKFPFSPANTGLESTPVTDFQCGKILFDLLRLANQKANSNDTDKGTYAWVALFIRNRLDSDPNAAQEIGELEASQQASGTTVAWPWGEYSTKLLGKLAAAADRFWKRYDPNDRTTAPTNETVVTWLKENEVSDRNAEVMATILRADGLPTGPRK